jgi:hypothetical protein
MSLRVRTFQIARHAAVQHMQPKMCGKMCAKNFDFGTEFIINQCDGSFVKQLQPCITV